MRPDWIPVIVRVVGDLYRIPAFRIDRPYVPLASSPHAPEGNPLSVWRATRLHGIFLGDDPALPCLHVDGIERARRRRPRVHPLTISLAKNDLLPIGRPCRV